MIKNLLLMSLGLFTLAACADSNHAPPNLNMVLSVSSDGNYAIATNTNKQAVLWNLKNHSYKIVFKDANIYSAYFIKNTDYFMYQNDANNNAVIEDVNGNVIKTFNPGFPTYGEAVTSNLRTYAASDENLSVYKIDLSNNQKYVLNQSWCLQDHNGAKYKGQGTSTCLNFMSSDQTFGLQFTPDETKLVGGNFFDLFIWDLKTNTGTMIQKNDAQTVAAINPDGSYVVTGDIEELGYMQSLHNLKQPGYKIQWSNPPDATTQAYFSNPENSQQILAMKFIDAQHVLVFYGAFPNLFNFATLHAPLSETKIDPSWNGLVLKPIKYLPLIPNAATDTHYQKDWPLTSDDFSRDQAIDTSPSAHILVMSMAEKNGIIVYQYDPSTQTLTRVWAGEVSWVDNHF